MKRLSPRSDILAVAFLTLAACGTAPAMASGTSATPGTSPTSSAPVAPLAAAASVPADLASPPSTIEGFATPESVLGVGAARFVSNIGPKLGPLTKDGDGFISRLDDSGNIVDRRFYPTGTDQLDAPKGMAAIGRTLYVADIDRVVGIDIETRKKTFEARLPGAAPALLNDLDVESERALVVSDTVRNCIFRLTLADRSFAVLADSIVGANGVAFDHDQHILFAVGLGSALGGGKDLGHFFSMPANGRMTSPSSGVSGLFDGIALLRDGTILVSDWVALDHPAPGRLRVIDRSGVEMRSIALPFEAHGPADFWVDPVRQRVWIPRSLDNSVSVIAIGG